MTFSIIFSLYFSFPASVSVSPSLCHSLRCCLAGQPSGQIIILKLKRGCLNTGLGDELSHRAGSCSGISSSQDGAVGPVSLSSSPRRLALLCCFLRCSGWLKCLADRPLLKTYPSMASDLWRMRSYTLIQRAAWRGASLNEFFQLQQEGQERKRQGERENKREKRTLSSTSFTFWNLKH